MKEVLSLLESISSDLDRMSSPYVSGDIGIANYLTFKTVTPEVKQIREHLTPRPISAKKTLYLKEEIDELIKNGKW